MTLSVEKREMVVRLHKTRMTLAGIASAAEVNRSTVVRILKHQRETGSITPIKPSGRPRALTPRDEREVTMIMRKDPFTRPSTLQNALWRTKHHPISTQTVRRTLHRAGLVAYKPRRKPRLKPAQRKARLEWANEYAQKPANFWGSVIFSDESSFHLHQAMRGTYV